MITIYHHTRCSKSRGAFCLLEDKHANFQVRNYLEQPLSLDELRALHKKLNLPLIDMVRTNEPLFKKLFENQQPSNDDLFNALRDNPALLQRPIIETEDAAIIARPPEKVLEFIG